MEMPVEVLERLGARGKRIADPEVNLEQLRRESEGMRRQWWDELERNRLEYSSLPFDRNKFLESNIALARLKLVVTFTDNGEPVPAGHGFRQEETNFIREFERYLVYDRLSAEDIKNYIRSGKDDEKGIVQLAKHAAVSGYDQMYKVLEQKNIPSDLAFALQRIYQDRIKKMEIAASELKLSEVYKDIATAEVGKGVVPAKAITAQDARLAERSYIAQVESRLHQPSKEWGWKNIEKFHHLDKIYSQLKALRPTSIEALRESIPSGAGLRAVIQASFLLIFKKTALTLELQVRSNYQELFLSGYAADKTAFSEMIRDVEATVARAKGAQWVLALASTIGWDDKSISYAQEGKALSPSLHLVLIDLKGKVLHYNLQDEKLKGAAPYLTP